MNKCLYCEKETDNPKFCSRSHSAIFNNKAYPKRNRISGNTSKEQLKKMSHIAKEKINAEKIDLFKNGKMSDVQVRRSLSIKQYILRQQNNGCAICGISFVEPIWMNKLVPFTVDHIDGDYRNNNPYNIRIICPICDRQSPTYGSRNKGKGRPKDKR